MIALRALYYPYSRCLNDDTLKRVALIFDEIWFLDPIGQDQMKRLGDAEIFALYEVPPDIRRRWEQYKPTYYNPLCEAGIVRFYDVSSVVSSHDNLIGAATAADLRDPSFTELCSGTEQRTWSTVEGRLPKSLMNHFPYNQGGFAESRGAIEFFQRYPQYWRRADEWEPEYKDIEIRRIVGLRDGKSPSTFYEMPYILGSSLYLNQALLVSESMGIPILTDSPFHHRLLVEKYRRGADTAKEMQLWQPAPAPSPMKLTALTTLALTVTYNLIPPEQLSQLSLDDILAYRKASAKEIERFKVLLNQLTADIQAQPWTSEFRDQMDRTIAKTIVPEVQRLHDRVSEISEAMFAGLITKTVKKVAATVTPALIASLLAGLSPGEIITMGTAAVASAVGLSIDDLVSYWRGNRSLRRNCLSYLAELGKT